MFTRTLSVATLLLALPLSACSGDEAAEELTSEATTDVTPVGADPAVTDASEVDVPGTVAALESGLTAIPMAAATDNINAWIATLDGAGFDGADEITTSLEALRTDLQSSPIDGAAIGAHLGHLGELTTAAASGASSSSQEGLMRLGELLSAAGVSLTGGA